MTEQDDLSRFRYHTGGSPRPLESDEQCPVLFRDIGPVGMSLHLTGHLKRLAGPLSPVVYLRTGDYEEPYTDTDQIGRLAFLKPKTMRPWHAGVNNVFIAPVHQIVDPGSVVVIPTEQASLEGETLLRTLPNIDAVHEHYGFHWYIDFCADVLSTCIRLNEHLKITDMKAQKARRILQSGSAAQRYRIRHSMQEQGVTEADLCGAWHHLTYERQQQLQDWLESQNGDFADAG